MEASESKKTPLYEAHLKAGGKIVDFHGWLLPVQYGGIIEEHERVRSSAGLFDVSHMGEIFVRGEDAGEYIQGIITNDISGAADGQEVYSPMCLHSGGTVDDLIVYRFDERNYMLVVNASNLQKDFEWIKENRKGRVEITNLSDEYAQLALQGPLAQQVLQKLTVTDLGSIGFFNFKENVGLGGVEALVSRSGYTGEDGFEIYVRSSDAVWLWDMILEAGRDEGVSPAGLGARDTLRFEAALPLYGNELSETITPVEAGLGRYVKPGKADFIGRDALVRQMEAGPERTLVGFEMVDRGVPRGGFEVLADGAKAGFVTSGSYSPSFKKNLGMALVDPRFASLGGALEIVIRDRPVKAQIVKLPFYKKKYRRL